MAAQIEQVVVLPVGLSLGKAAAIAGATILRDRASGKWTLLCYTQANGQQRHLLREELDTAAWDAKPRKHAKTMLELELDPQGESGGMVQTVEGKKQQWRCKFQTRAEGFRLLCLLAVAELCDRVHRAAPSVYGAIDLRKGEGKSCKEGSYAQVSVRSWVVPLGALSAPVCAQLGKFHPQSDDSLAEGAAQPADVSVTGAAAEGAPFSLGAWMYKRKIGSSCLLALPGGSEEVKGLGVAAGSASDALLLLVRVDGTSKRRKHKKSKREPREAKARASKKKGEEEAAAAAVVAAATAAVKEPSKVAATEASTTVADKTAEPVSQQPQSSRSETKKPKKKEQKQKQKQQQQQQSAVLSAEEQTAAAASRAKSLSGLLGALKTMRASVKAQPATQTQVVQDALSTFFKGALADLRAKEGVDIALVKPVVMTHMRAVLGSYKEGNSSGANGTLKGTSEALKEFMGLFHPYATGEGQLTEAGLQRLVAQAGGGGGSAAAEEEAEALRAELAAAQGEQEALRRQLEEQGAKLAKLGEQQAQLAETNIELSDQLEAAQKVAGEVEEIRQKAEMSSMFEQGLTDMRKLLETEASEKQKLEQEMADLNAIKGKCKLVWVPDNAVSACMSCNATFGRFSKKKHHCRFCGRVFCADCSSKELELPELGYKGSVRVCNSCHDLKTQQ